jgi:hypothetical protein
MEPSSSSRYHWIGFCCLSGLTGSLLFLAGDMLFYGSFSSGAAFHSLAEMAQRPVPILVAGGALGPIASIFSAAGMGFFFFTLASVNRKLALTSALLMAVTMLLGGSYHALFTCFGFAARVADEPTRETLIHQVAGLRDTVGMILYATGLSGTAIVYFLGFSRRAALPRWLLIFLPSTLSLATSVFSGVFAAIPAPIGGIVRGGWINGCFVLFFAIATIAMRFSASFDSSRR